MYALNRPVKSLYGNYNMQISKLRTGVHRPDFTRLSLTKARRHIQICATSQIHGEPTFPMDLPLFPVKPIGVFVPGMTKTLHLYESHFLEMLQESLNSTNRLLAVSVMEPFMGKAEQSASMGAYVGGSNCVFSHSCLVKVLDSKPYVGGYLVRIRGEARIGITDILQVDPYHRARVFNLPDPCPGRSDLESLSEAVEKLDDVMRGVQMLASKFRCDETASIQQAFRYINETPLVPNIQEPLPPLPPEADIVVVPQETANDNHSHASGSGLHMSGDTGDARADTGQAGRSTDEKEGLSSQYADGTSLAASTHMTTQIQQQKKKSEQFNDETEDEEGLDLQRACRLSYASLQWLPEATVEERCEILRGRLLAMESCSLPERLALSTQVMDAARASLAAKCAIMSMR